MKIQSCKFKVVLLFLIVKLFFCSSIFAQSTETIIYKNVIRNNSGFLIRSKQIGMQVNILRDTTEGKAIYVETQTLSSDGNGIVTIEIGSGTVESGVFDNIDWEHGVYFIKTKIDTTGGLNYSIISGNQILSVAGIFYSNNFETGMNEVILIEPASIDMTEDKQNSIPIMISQTSDYENNSDKATNHISVSKDGPGEGLKDIDGNIYSSVIIGGQEWMSENLRVTHYPNGDAIPLVKENKAWSNLSGDNTSDAYTYYNNASSEDDIFGALCFSNLKT